MPPVNTEAAAAGELPVPLYEHVKRRISEAILLGEWPPGALLPGEVALATQFGVAVGTVRRALADLVGEGMLTRRRRSGTVVTGRSPQHSLRFFFQYFRLHGEGGELLRSVSRTLALGQGAARAEEAQALDIATGSRVIRLDRLRLVAGKPVMHDHIVLPGARVPGFPDTAEAMPDLLYLYLLDRYGLRIAAVRERVTAELANAEDHRLLDLPDPSAVLAIAEVALDHGGVPVLIAHHRAMTQGFVYVNEAH